MVYVKATVVCTLFGMLKTLISSNDSEGNSSQQVLHNAGRFGFPAAVYVN